jgi:hypothetical protein
MNNTESSRGDSRCLDYVNSSTVTFKNKGISRNYSYNMIFGEGESQEDLFYSLSLNVSYFSYEI